MTPETFKGIRKYRKLTQIELAGLIGRSDRDVRQWESGARKIPNPVQVIMFSLGNNIDVKYLKPMRYKYVSEKYRGTIRVPCDTYFRDK